MVKEDDLDELSFMFGGMEGSFEVDLVQHGHISTNWQFNKGMRRLLSSEVTL